jgi:hypothetical protein
MVIIAFERSLPVVMSMTFEGIRLVAQVVDHEVAVGAAQDPLLADSLEAADPDLRPGNSRARYGVAGPSVDPEPLARAEAAEVAGLRPRAPSESEADRSRRAST